MSHGQISRNTFVPLLEPPKYLKLGINVEAIMKRNKMTMYTENKKCELKKIEERRQTKINFPNMFSISKITEPNMQERKIYKNLKVSTISLYHQMDRDIRSVSKEDVTRSNHSEVSNLPSATSLLRLGVPYTIDRSRRKSRAILSHKQIHNIISGRKSKKKPLRIHLANRELVECSEINPKRKQQVREEILSLIATKERKDKGVDNEEIELTKDDQQNVKQESIANLASKHKGIDNAGPSRGECGLKDEGTDRKKSSSCKEKENANGKDDISLREMRNINKAFGIGTPTHDRLAEGMTEEDAREGFSAFVRENVQRRNKRELRKQNQRYNPSTVSLYHYILQDFRGNSNSDFKIAMEEISEMSFTDMPKVNSSLGLINKFSLMSSGDPSFFSLDWKWLLPGERRGIENKFPKKHGSVRLTPTFLQDKCAVKKAFSDECATQFKEGTCDRGTEDVYGPEKVEQGQSQPPWNQPPSSKFMAELEKWTKERGLKSLLCDIMEALRKSKTTNEARFIAEYLEAKLDMKELKDRSSQYGDDQYSYANPGKEKHSASYSEQVTFAIYESLKKRFCRKTKEEGSKSNVNIDDRSLCSTETSHKSDEDDEDDEVIDVCDPCYLSSDPIMLSSYEGKSPYERFKKEKKRKLKCTWPPPTTSLKRGEIDLGEKEIESDNDIAFLNHVLKMKGLNLHTVFGEGDEGDKDFKGGEGKEDFKECEWWNKIIAHGKQQYENYIKRKNSNAWFCHHYRGGERQSLLPYRKPVKGMSEEEKKMTEFVRDLCSRKRESAAIFNCKMRKENFKSLAMTLLKEKRKGFDTPQPPEALIPDRPSDFPEEGFRKLLEEEKALREKLRKGKESFVEIVKKQELKMDEIACPKDCASWPDYSLEKEDLLLREKGVEPKDELIQIYIKLSKELREWNSEELLLTRYVNEILKKVYPHQHLLNKYTKFNLTNGVDYLNSLVVAETLENENMYEFIDTLEEHEYVRMLIRICQDCPRLPTMNSWVPETVMFDLDQFGIDKLPVDPADPSEDEIKAVNWSKFFDLTRLMYKSNDYGRYKPYLHFLEEPDEISEPDEILKPLKSNRLKELWQDLPATISLVDMPGGKIELRPSERIVRDSGKSDRSQKGEKSNSEDDDSIKITKIEEIMEYTNFKAPKYLEYNNVFQEDEQQRKSILEIIADVIETETVTLSKIHTVVHNSDSGNNDAEIRKKISLKRPSTGIVVTPVIQDEEEEKKMSKFHVGMEKMFQSLTSSRYKNLDGMEERLEVMETDEREVVRSRPSVMLDESPKLAQRLISDSSKIATIEELKAKSIDDTEVLRREDDLKTEKLFDRNLMPANIDKDYFATSESAVARKIFLKQNPNKNVMSSTPSSAISNADTKVRGLSSRHSQLDLVIGSSKKFSIQDFGKTATKKMKHKVFILGGKKEDEADKEEEEEK